MDQEVNNNKQKYIAAFVVLASIVIVAFGVTFFKKKESAISTGAESTISGTASGNSNSGATGASAKTSASAATQSTPSNTTANYKDGTYSASGSYVSPGGTERISVSVTVKDGVVTDSTVSQVANNRESEEYQAKFRNNYKSQVVGKKLSSISLSRVSGSSLTSGGFNDALDTIKSQAQV
jgi:hypothetical protein